VPYHHQAALKKELRRRATSAWRHQHSQSQKRGPVFCSSIPPPSEVFHIPEVRKLIFFYKTETWKAESGFSTNTTRENHHLLRARMAGSSPDLRQYARDANEFGTRLQRMRATQAAAWERERERRSPGGRSRAARGLAGARAAA